MLNGRYKKHLLFFIVGIGILFGLDFSLYFLPSISRLHIGADLEIAAQKSRKVWAGALKKQDVDIRTEGEVLIDLKRKGIKAYVFPSMKQRTIMKSDGTLISKTSLGAEQFYPLSGVSEETVTGSNTDGYYPLFQLDRYGFNNPPGTWRYKNVQIFGIGSAELWDQGLNYEQSVMFNLRKKYPHSINASQRIGGIVQNYATIVEYAQKVKPKVILWFFYEGSVFSFNEDEKKFPFLMQYLKNGFKQNLMERQGDIDAQLRPVFKETTESKIQDFVKIGLKRKNMLIDTLLLRRIRHLLKEIFGMVDVWKKESKAELLEMGRNRDNDFAAMVLAKGQSLAEKWGGKLLVVYIPDLTRYCDIARNIQVYYNKVCVGTYVKVKELDIFKNDLFRKLFNRGIPTLDITPAYEKIKDKSKLFSVFSTLPSAFDEKIISREIIKKLEVMGILEGS